MSRHGLVVKDVKHLKGNICRVHLAVERPDKASVGQKQVMKTTNEFVYVGEQNMWLSEDGKNLAPEEHQEICNKNALLLLLRLRYKAYLNQ